MDGKRGAGQYIKKVADKMGGKPGAGPLVMKVRRLFLIVALGDLTPQQFIEQFESQKTPFLAGPIFG
jgi:hypothetical protein